MSFTKIITDTNADIIMKGALLLGSAGVALILSGTSSDEKKKKKKSKGFVASTKSINSTANALCRAFYLHDLKKNGDGFPVKLVDAEIIDI